MNRICAALFERGWMRSGGIFNHGKKLTQEGVARIAGLRL
jgi:hypothetical protein